MARSSSLNGFDESAPEAIARRQTVGEREMFFQPVVMERGPAMNGRGAVTAADDAADGDDDNVPKKVFAIARMTRIGEGLKERTNGFDIDELRHENILEIEANRPANTFAFNDCSRSKDMAHRPGAQDPYLTQLCARTLGEQQGRCARPA